MKLAILSDIHGNLSALNAVLDDLKHEHIDHYIIPGDFLGDGPQPKEVIKTLQSLKATIIKGNRELYIMDYHQGLNPAWDQHDQMATMVWTYQQLSNDELTFIEQLPLHTVLQLPNVDPIMIVHGSIQDVYEHLYPNHEATLRTFNEMTVSTLICGHTHQPWFQKKDEKLIINPGAVGVHFNHRQASEYGLLTFTNNEWVVEHRQVNYDLNELQQQFITSGLMDASPIWSKTILLSLQKGRNISIEFLKFAYQLAKELENQPMTLLPNELWYHADNVFDWDD